ncbi:hypothetical protein M433DRAFT_134077 [Acidomyces richmondensis BFW]|nr:hypothetical protein M433DRAFT_134077 [Acidomyces richmondensis BFW]
MISGILASCTALRTTSSHTRALFSHHLSSSSPPSIIFSSFAHARVAVATVASLNTLRGTIGNLTGLFFPAAAGSLGAAIQSASQKIERFLQTDSTRTANHLPVFVDWQEKLTGYAEKVTDLFAGRSTLENTSILLALCTFLVVAMSWTSRFGNIGRFSPFTRSPPQGSTRVSDADFSYITTEDLRKHAAETNSSHQQPGSPADYGPPRDSDVLVLRNKKQDYYLQFPAYSIAKGELTVGQLREQAAKKIGTTPRRVKLLYRGKTLKDDGRTCKQEGLRDSAELLLTFTDSGISNSTSSDEDSEEQYGADGDDQVMVGDGQSKRKRNRGKRTKKRNRREQQQQQQQPFELSGRAETPQPTSNLAPHSHTQPQSQSAPATRGPSPSPKPAPTPATPLEKLKALQNTLSSYIPQVRSFIADPPRDAHKREFEYKRLSETILAQVLLKLDAVETEGDTDTRTRRKELVRETQAILQELDAAAKA